MAESYKHPEPRTPEALPGRLETLTPEQQKVLENFKQQIKEKSLFNDERHSDHTLLRFLRARKFDLSKTLDMFIACEQWRKEKDVENLFSNFVYEEAAEVQKFYPRFYHGVDLYGRPIYIEQLATLDLDKLFKVTTKERLEMCFIKEYERLTRIRFPACSQQAGRNVETSFSILDLDGCSVMQAYRIKDILQLIISIGQNYYPETMGVMFIINAPWVFSTIWSFIKMWMDEVTVKKIIIISAGKDFKKELEAFVDLTGIPQNILKGTGALKGCECEGGCMNSDKGPWNVKGKEEA